MLLKCPNKNKRTKKCFKHSLKRGNSQNSPQFPAPEKPISIIVPKVMPEKSPPHKNIGEQDDMTADLARRIGTAIEEWKQKYQLEKIPSKILLDKAINIIRIMKETL